MILVLAALPLAAADRAALLIGNRNYPGDPDAPESTPGKLIRLDSCAQDVRVMSAALQAVGFTVETQQDLTALQMKQAVIAFQQKYKGTREVLFYFSGHGAQVAGENYLTGIDSDADLERETLELEAQFSGDELKQRLEGVEREAAEKRCLPLRQVLANLHLMTPTGIGEDERAQQVRIVILDACRSAFNTAALTKGVFLKKGGLAAADGLKRAGVFIGFAAAANEVSLAVEGQSPSLFTQHFAQRLQQPGDIGTVFKEARIAVNKAAQETAGIRQFPAYYDELEAGFAFVPGDSKLSPPPPPPPIDSLAGATRERPFVNSLGLEFIPLPGNPGVFMCRTETRVRDFRAYARATDYGQTGGAFVLKVKGDATKGYSFNWKLDTTASWEKPGFTQSEDHPVCCVQLTEAEAFAAWLSQKEGKTYRLPTDAEWSAAVGVGKYPWGSAWPPPKGVGNYFGAEAKDSLPKAEWSTAYGHSDGFARTAPVGSFDENKYGFYDLGGNLWEWCSDRYRASMNSQEVLDAFPALKEESAADGTPYRVLRGGSWLNNDSSSLLSSSRGNGQPTGRLVSCGFRLVLVSGG